MNNQIDSSSQANMGGGGAHDQINTDRQKLEMQDSVQEFMNSSEMKKRVRSLVGHGNRLNVNIDEIRSLNPGLARYIIKNPIEAIRMFEDNLNQGVRSLENEEKSEKQAAQTSDLNFPKKRATYYVNFTGNVGQNFVTPRGLKS